MIFQSYWHVFCLCPHLLHLVVHFSSLDDTVSIVTSNNIHLPKKSDSSSTVSIFCHPFHLQPLL